MSSFYCYDNDKNEWQKTINVAYQVIDSLKNQVEEYQKKLEFILSKNKYLHLAHYLQKNRGDWSDGYSYAETGLENFSIESDTDQKIYDEIKELIDDWDFDGRCFRDCNWNYSVLFGMVDDKDLMTDYEFITSNYSEV